MNFGFSETNKQPQLKYLAISLIRTFGSSSSFDQQKVGALGIYYPAFAIFYFVDSN